jgi:hypothetical protein
MYRSTVTAADERLLKARAVVRSRDELIAQRDAVVAEIARVTDEIPRLEKHIDERARGFLRISYRPRQAEDVARLRDLTQRLERLTTEQLAIGAQLAGFTGAVRELAAAREEKHAILLASGAPTSADLAEIATALAREDARANELDDAIVAAVRTELPLRRAAALLRALDAREPVSAELRGWSVRGLVREAQQEAVPLWDRFIALQMSVSRNQLAERFASLLAYVQVDGRIIEARATTAALIADLMTQSSVLHQRAAEIARRVAALVTERDHLLE